MNQSFFFIINTNTKLIGINQLIYILINDSNNFPERKPGRYKIGYFIQNTKLPGPINISIV